MHMVYQLSFQVTNDLWGCL